MRVVILAVCALLVLSVASASSSTVINDEVSAAEENDFAVDEQIINENDELNAESDLADAASTSDEDEADEFAFVEADEDVADDAEDSDEADDEAEAEADEEVDEEDEEMAGAEAEEEAEVDAVDEELVEEENVDVFAESDSDASPPSPEHQTINWLNKARTGDKKVIEELTRMSKLFTDKSNPLLMIDGSLRLQTQEGVKAVNGAIAAMKKHKAVGKLAAAKGLGESAAELVSDIGPKGELSHVGSDGSTPFVRMDRFGQWEVTAGENIATGSNVGRHIVMQMLIDDGVKGRGHRENVLNPQFHRVGVKVGPHKTYGFVAVQDFAGGYKDKPSTPKKTL